MLAVLQLVVVLVDEVPIQRLLRLLAVPSMMVVMVVVVMMPMAAATAGAAFATAVLAGNRLRLAGCVQRPLVNGFADFRRRPVGAVRFARCGRSTGAVVTDRFQPVPLKVCHLYSS